MNIKLSRIPRQLDTVQAWHTLSETGREWEEVDGQAEIIYAK